MQAIFYILGIRIYYSLILVFSLINNKAKSFIRGRKNWRTTLKQAVSNHKKDEFVWFHCASLGEFEQARPVIEAISMRYPDLGIALTFFSPSGYEIRKNYEVADLVMYLPMDTSRNARDFVSLLNPKLVLFVKYEFWHHYIKTIKNHNIPLLSISTILRPGQIYFKWYGGFYRKMLNRISHFFVQNGTSKQLLKNIDVEQVTLAGDTRFDRVKSITSSAKPLIEVQDFIGNQRTFIVGSAWPEDMEVLYPFINEQPLKYIIAPHELSEKFMSDINSNLDKKVIRYSNLAAAKGDEEVLLIDNIGMLSSLYGQAQYAFIGGGYGAGLHNILEAATFGMPVFFGNKNYKKFDEAVSLIESGGAFTISDTADMIKTFNEVSAPERYKAICSISSEFVNTRTGATEKIMSYIDNLFQS